VIKYLDDAPEAIQLLDRLADEGIAISIVTYMEVYQGVERAPDPHAAEEKLQAFLDAVPLLVFTSSVARRCARSRETLRKQGKRLKPRALDLIIAATALEHGLVLVTGNEDDYKDIPGLRLYRGS
jgi:tRNA(fMet)-specific endonuclease VapC